MKKFSILSVCISDFSGCFHKFQTIPLNSHQKLTLIIRDSGLLTKKIVLTKLLLELCCAMSSLVLRKKLVMCIENYSFKANDKLRFKQQEFLKSVHSEKTTNYLFIDEIDFISATMILITKDYCILFIITNVLGFYGYKVIYPLREMKFLDLMPTELMGAD